MRLSKAICDNGIAPTIGEARRLIFGGSIKLNGQWILKDENLSHGLHQIEQYLVVKIKIEVV